jgi:hypothetical protein
MNSPGARLGGAILWCAALRGIAIPPSGQQGAGGIRLQVTDPSGATMRASVRLRSRSAKIDRSVLTDTKAAAVLAGLPFGRYRLEVSMVKQTVTMALGAQASPVDEIPAPAPGAPFGAWGGVRFSF